MIINLINEMDESLSPIEQILVNRGLEKEKISDFLNTDDSVINDYKLLSNISEGVNCLIKHYEEGNKILIQVDSDVDGYTSAALLFNYLIVNFPGIDIDYQVHNEKIHGLKLIENIDKYKLIIIPDAGSNEYEKHSFLKELGIDIIILDHHECEYESPDAIVINNQTSENYPNKSLSGVGIVYQFCRALDDISDTDINKHVTKADMYLDLVAVGLVADMMDLRELETKRLVEKGIQHLLDRKYYNNKFLMGLVDKQAYSLKNEVTPIGIAFYIAPLINAVVRVGTPEERLFVFETFLVHNFDKVIPSTKRGHKGEEELQGEQAIRLLTNIKNRQKRQRDDAFDTYEKHITDQYLNENSIILVDTKSKVNKNLNGLVANQIMAKYQRPTLVVSLETVEDESGEKKEFYMGSARNFETKVLENFKEFINESGLAEFAEGHASAFGVKFAKENLHKFLDHANQALDFSTDYNEYKVDFIFSAEELEGKTILDIASLKPFWGKGLEEALIAICGIKVTSVDKILMSKDKNPTLKIMIGDIACIKFSCSLEEFDRLAPNDYTTSVINIVGKCNKNEWMGNVNPQILIENYEIVQNIVEF